MTIREQPGWYPKTAASGVLLSRVQQTGQIQKVVPFTSRRTAQRRLRALLDHRLVKAHLQGEALHRANVYTLTERGREHVAERFGELPARTRLPRPAKLRHALQVRDVFTAFLAAERTAPLEIESFAFEEQLAAQPRFSSAGLIPDAWAVVEARGPQAIGVEVDCGTETTTTLRAKFTRWQRLLAGPEKAATLLVTVEHPGRLRTMQAVLRDVGLTNAVVIELSTVAGWLSARCTRPLFARRGRAVRIGAPSQPADIPNERRATRPAFRALGPSDR